MEDASPASPIIKENWFKIAINTTKRDSFGGGCHPTQWPKKKKKEEEEEEEEEEEGEEGPRQQNVSVGCGPAVAFAHAIAANSPRAH